MSPSPETSLNNATVLLCGAGGGLGAALGAELEARGAVLTLVGRNAERLDALALAGSRLVADLRDPEACAEAVQLAAESSDGIDVVINAVGVVAFGPITEMPTAALTDLVQTNVLIPMLLARAALPRIRPGGAIVNLSGIIAEPGQVMLGMAAYAASKAAVRALDEALMREARRAKVRVIDARPPHTETGLADHPIAGSAPKMGTGIGPALVARVICDALEHGDRDLPSEAFTA